MVNQNYLIYPICLILGICQKLPWTCFTNSHGYWMRKFSFDEDLYVKQKGVFNFTLMEPMTFYQKFWTSFMWLTVAGVYRVVLGWCAIFDPIRFSIRSVFRSDPIFDPIRFLIRSEFRSDPIFDPIRRSI